VIAPESSQQQRQSNWPPTGPATSLEEQPATGNLSQKAGHGCVTLAVTDIHGKTRRRRSTSDCYYSAADRSVGVCLRATVQAGGCRHRVCVLSALCATAPPLLPLMLLLLLHQLMQMLPAALARPLRYGAPMFS